MYIHSLWVYNRYLLIFNFMSGFNNHFVGEENSFWIQWKGSCLLDKVLKYTSRLLWLTSPNSVWSCPAVFFMVLVSACRLVSSRHNSHEKPSGLGKQACYFASSRVKIKSPFNLMGTAEVRSNFSFSQGRFFFSMRCLHFLSDFWEFLHFLDVFL